tara:strand:+ start:1092 stop:1265 length:174 start_codon:yes stop_codon:yes gene_type:complete
MIEFEKGSTYNILWVDGVNLVKCVFLKEHRGFFIFVDKNGMKIVCRPSSVESITKVV